jgi:hypothetical protein
MILQGWKRGQVLRSLSELLVRRESSIAGTPEATNSYLLVRIVLASRMGGLDHRYSVRMPSVSRSESVRPAWVAPRHRAPTVPVAARNRGAIPRPAAWPRHLYCDVQFSQASWPRASRRQSMALNPRLTVETLVYPGVIRPTTSPARGTSHTRPRILVALSTLRTRLIEGRDQPRGS